MYWLFIPAVMLAWMTLSFALESRNETRAAAVVFTTGAVAAIGSVIWVIRLLRR